MEISNLETVVNKEKSRFEIKLGEKTAFIDYIINNQQQIFLTHTEVPVAHEGKGVASKMAKDALDWIENNGYKVFANCPYIAAFIKRNPQYKGLLANP